MGDGALSETEAPARNSPEKVDNGAGSGAEDAGAERAGTV
jgi:hypothetical protein